MLTVSISVFQGMREGGWLRVRRLIVHKLCRNLGRRVVMVTFLVVMAFLAMVKVTMHIRLGFFFENFNERNFCTIFYKLFRLKVFSTFPICEKKIYFQVQKLFFINIFLKYSNIKFLFQRNAYYTSREKLENYIKHLFRLAHTRSGPRSSNNS